MLRRMDKGFTLIEVMAAMLILALVCVAYSENQVGAIQLVKATRFREKSILLATQKMAEIDFLVQTKGLEILKDEDKGDFENENFEGYSWRYTRKQVPTPDFAALMGSTGVGEEGEPQAQQQGLEGGPMKMVMDMWAKSIMEVRLEITWKEGEQEKSYSLLTHYIASNASSQIQGLVGAMTGGAGAAAGGNP